MKRTRVVLARQAERSTNLDAPPTPGDETKTSHGGDLAESRGHRYGNFHNYYHFHPTDERIKLLTKKSGILDYVAKRWQEQNNPSELTNREPFRDGGSGPLGVAPIKKLKSQELDSRGEFPTKFEYMDIGCNEGDLTMDVATALQHRLDNHYVQVMGVDLDPVLIERAHRKFVTSGTDQQTPLFQVCNMLSDGWPKDQSVDLTSIFSTTMWIHIHGGDEGLKRVLTDACQHTKNFILIEPQPSKCYRNAMLRLRKMGLAEFDVSSDRLHLRPRIDEEINKILTENSFARVVDFGYTVQDSSAGLKEEDKTTWSRSLWLYERITGSLSLTLHNPS